jgi:tetratricopeptide (TPR) repeat protein
MNASGTIVTHMIALVLAAAGLGLLAPSAVRADELRNLRRGEPLPPFRLVSIDGELIDSSRYTGSVLVIVYLAAEQRSSELAAIDARKVVDKLAAETRSGMGGQGGEATTAQGEDVADAPAPAAALLFITADVVRKSYFERFRQERNLDVPLALDADRSLYGKLGLIVFPTTLIINAEGKLAQVISLHNPDYAHVLDAHLQHASAAIDDAELRERLLTRPASEGSPKSRASAHRALARQLREKGSLEGARGELLAARALDEENIEILLDLAETELSLGEVASAAAHAEAALTRNPTHRRAKQVLAVTLFHKGRLEEAERILIQALHLNPDPARIHYYLGRICEQQGRTGEALEHYRRALARLLNESTPAP